MANRAISNRVFRTRRRYHTPQSGAKTFSWVCWRVIMAPLAGKKEKGLRIVHQETEARERALAGWNREPVDDGAADYWSRLVIEGEAPSSQYDRLREQLPAAADNEEGPEAWVALQGRGFHGQRHRPWQAEAGNLHLSVRVPMDLAAGPDSLAWTMLPAVAVMQALRALGPQPVAGLGIKWVNDILYRGAKVGGVLSSVVQDGDRLRRGHLGIGLNIEVAPQLSSGGNEGPTSCLARWLTPAQRGHGRVLRTLLGALARNIRLLNEGRGAAISAAYRADSLLVGRQVRILSDPLTGPARELARGRVLAVNADLSLTLAEVVDPIRQGRAFLLDEPCPG